MEVFGSLPPVFPETKILKFISGLSFGITTATVGDGTPVEAAILKLPGKIDFRVKMFDVELKNAFTVGSVELM